MKNPPLATNNPIARDRELEERGYAQNASYSVPDTRYYTTRQPFHVPPPEMSLYSRLPPIVRSPRIGSPLRIIQRFVTGSAYRAAQMPATSSIVMFSQNPYQGAEEAHTGNVQPRTSYDVRRGDKVVLDVPAVARRERRGR